MTTATTATPTLGNGLPSPSASPSLHPNPPKFHGSFPLPKGARIAVIGAGGAGLAMIKAIREKGFTPVAFEVQETVGGTWILAEAEEHADIRLDQGCNGKEDSFPTWRSSMYESLKTNLPKEIMAFPDLPFDSSLPSFVTRDEVLQYLKNYANVNDLNEFIRFKTWVKKVEPLDGRGGYKVTSISKERGEEIEEYDAVAVCNGHYATPNIPVIRGLSTFPNPVLHSHGYRNEKPFAGQKNVILVGAGPSGVDLALELAKVVEQVWLVHDHVGGAWFKDSEVKNVIEVKKLVSLQDDGKAIVVMPESDREGDETTHITTENTFDTVILCTGYKPDFPFLDMNDEKVGLTVEAKMIVTPLYRDLLNMYRPDMCFICIPFQIIPFPLMHHQARWVAALWAGHVPLPPLSARLDHYMSVVDTRSKLYVPYKKRYFHKMRSEQFDYCRELAREVGEAGPVEEVWDFYEMIGKSRRTGITSYRQVQYALEGGKWVSM